METVIINWNDDKLAPEVDKVAVYLGRVIFRSGTQCPLAPIYSTTFSGAGEEGKRHQRARYE